MDVNDSVEQHNLSVNTSKVLDFVPVDASSPLNTTKVQDFSKTCAFPYLQSSAPHNSVLDIENMGVQLINTSENNSKNEFTSPTARNLVINGNRLEIKYYRINQSLMQLHFRNTCPFDSILELLTSAYIQNNNFALHVNKNKHNNLAGILNVIVDYCETSFQEELLYINRAQLLYSHYKLQKKSTRNTIYCEDNIMKAFEYF